jgi:hypothetical protein
VFYLVFSEINESFEEEELSSSELEKIRRFFCLDVFDRFLNFLDLL